MGNGEKTDDHVSEPAMSREAVAKQMGEVIDSAFHELGNKKGNNSKSKENRMEDMIENAEGKLITPEKMLHIMKQMVQYIHKSPSVDILESVPKGPLEGFRISLENGFNSTVDYSDSEKSKAILKRSMSLGDIVWDIQMNLIRKNYNRAKVKVSSLLKENTLFLKEYPNVFLGYSSVMAWYYLFSGCLSVISKNKKTARQQFLYGWIYECIYHSRSIDSRNVNERLIWMRDYLANLCNFNKVYRGKRIETPFEHIKFHHLARIFVSYLLSVRQGNPISQKAVWAFGQYIIKMLDISEMRKEIEIDFENEKQVLNEIHFGYRTPIKEEKYLPMTQEDWDFVLPTLQKLQREIKGFDTVDDLADHVYASIFQ